MFNNRSAWFSSSVPHACHDFWIIEGGVVTGWRTADYLFSADATCADTLRIFDSREYRRSKVTVFHTSFLSTCERRQSVKSVWIGHYVLPPASVQDDVRHVVGRLIWEFEDVRSVVQGSCSNETEDERSDVSRNISEPSDTDSSESEVPPCAHRNQLSAQMCPLLPLERPLLPTACKSKAEKDLLKKC